VFSADREGSIEILLINTPHPALSSILEERE
jgi:hypothetical protein